ncbi:MAG: fibronectin type III domain-containing protein [Calditrichota bacterium]
MNPSCIKIFGISILFVILLGYQTVSADPSPSPSASSSALSLTAFEGESMPGTVALINLSWKVTGTPPDGMTFRLYKPDTAGVLVPFADIPGSSRSYTVPGLPGRLEIPYRLEVRGGNVVQTQIETVALVARRGGFAKVQAQDVPHDAGGAIQVTWQMSDPATVLREVKIFRFDQTSKKWTPAGQAAGSELSYVDAGLTDGKPYTYLVRANSEGALYESEPLEGIISKASWFDFRKINLLVILVMLIVALNWFVVFKNKGPLFIRRIAGLQAVEEAVGRATEMGRSVLFVPGIQDLDDVQTIAGLTLLGSVAKLTAKYETKLDVPVARSLVMSNGREVVREAYLSVGRPDFYNEDIVHYITDEQFGYVAAVDGIMVREKPAACFYLGAFFAESLILAETGNHVGAIQIAGTAMPTQLPFFVAACDYTLIGEELFAASAYLSGDQRAIASLRGQDVGKIMAMGSILLGSVLVTISTLGGGTGFWGKLTDGFIRLFALNY